MNHMAFREAAALAALCMDYESGEVYYEKNADLALPTASMTKVMAGYLVFDEIANGALALDSRVTASEYAAGISSDPEYSGYERLKAGGRYQVDTLLRLVFTASCNGSMIALAENIAGSEAAFVARMNAKALEMSIDAHYADCCGIIDEGNACSPRAMALLASRTIRDHPIILRYSSLPSFDFQGESFDSTNLLLRNGSVTGMDGLKTGTTNGAGYCFTGTAIQNGRRIIAVVMNANSYDACMNECKRLFEYGFACRRAKENLRTGDV